MKRLHSFAAIALLAGLSACGGGDDKPAVTSIQANPAMFGRTATVTVQGANLASGITATMQPGCGVMTRTAVGSDSLQTFSCRITHLGDVRVTVRQGSSGDEIASLRLDIPLPQVTFTASQGANTGSFVVELDPTKAQTTVDNFLGYVNQSTCFYRNTLFHRVIEGAIVQGGGFTTGMTPKTEGLQPPIPLESNNGLKNVRGTIAMARTVVPNSATSQFYVNVKDNPDFDYKDAANPGYAVFGTVISGMADIDRLNKVPVTAKVGADGGTYFSVPVDEVVIQSCLQSK